MEVGKADFMKEKYRRLIIRSKKGRSFSRADGAVMGRQEALGSVCCGLSGWDDILWSFDLHFPND